MQQSQRKLQSPFWLLMISLVLSFTILVYPPLVLLPSRSQGVRELAVALAVLRARPFIEILCVVVAFITLLWHWRSHVSRPRRILFTMAPLLVGVFAGLSFINVYEMSKSNKLLDLDLPISAIYLLATPSTPEAAKIEIVERAQAGEPLPVAEIKHLVQKHRANGKAHKQPSKKKNSALKRLEAFMDAISFVESICTATSEMEVPTLDKQRGSEAIAQLREAVAALNVLCNEVARKSVESE